MSRCCQALGKDIVVKTRPLQMKLEVVAHRWIAFCSRLFPVGLTLPCYQIGALSDNSAARSRYVRTYVRQSEALMVLTPTIRTAWVNEQLPRPIMTGSGKDSLKTTANLILPIIDNTTLHSWLLGDPGGYLTYTRYQNKPVSSQDAL